MDLGLKFHVFNESNFVCEIFDLLRGRLLVLVCLILILIQNGAICEFFFFWNQKDKKKNVFAINIMLQYVVLIDCIEKKQQKINTEKKENKEKIYTTFVQKKKKNQCRKKRVFIHWMKMMNESIDVRNKKWLLLLLLMLLMVIVLAGTIVIGVATAANCNIVTPNRYGMEKHIHQSIDLKLGLHYDYCCLTDKNIRITIYTDYNEWTEQVDVWTGEILFSRKICVFVRKSERKR